MDRPRRSTRPSAKLQAASEVSSYPPTAVPVTARPKRKTKDAGPSDLLHFLLKNPKSLLATMDISDLVNAGSWSMLSPESQNSLKALLPPTAFLSFKATINSEHPSASDSMVIDQANSGSSADILDMSIFTDSHFLAAAHTLQDHIFSDWMSDAHLEKVKKYEAGIRDGTLSAAWKDEVWERNNTTSHTILNGPSSIPSNNIREPTTRAGEAAEVRLVTLAKNNVLRVGDVIAYKRNFTNVNLTVEKDAIVESIHPKTSTLTLLFESGMAKHLPSQLLLPNPGNPSALTQSTTITSPTMLETALLDSDARVEKSRRPNGNAWKCFSVWRWRGEHIGDIENGRGGRENHGTLFYLRGTYYHER